MDHKDVWVVTKFIVSATGLKRRDARKILDEIPGDRLSRLFLMARGWERDASQQASRQLETLLGNDSLATLTEAAELSKIPSGPGTDEDDEPELKRPAKKTRRR